MNRKWISPADQAVLNKKRREAVCLARIYLRELSTDELNKKLSLLRDLSHLRTQIEEVEMEAIREELEDRRATAARAKILSQHAR